MSAEEELGATLEVQQNPEPTETDQDDSDSDSSDESFPEDAPPPRKRRKSQGKRVVPATKKHVRGKQGALKNFMGLPIEVFTQIVESLAPEDLLVLSRANKFFRNLLMRRPATQIWRRSLENIPHLPPCPTDMSEPQYSALLFSKYCLDCGKSVRRKVDTQLRIRMCPPCLEKNTVGSHRTPWDVLGLVPRSIPTNRSRSSYRHIKFLKSDVDATHAKYKELKAAGNQEAMAAWRDERLQYVQERKDHGDALTSYLESIVGGREEELQMLKTERRAEIERRLAELGWTDDKDLEFPWHTDSRRSWTGLVDQPKPLTERIWENIEPKLISLLEANRERRLAQEKAERRRVRRYRLYELLEQIRKSAPPLVEMLKSERDDPPSEGDPAMSAAAEKSTMVSLPAPFPKFADACRWKILKDLSEDEIPVPELEVLFAERREQIDQEIFDWRQGVELELVERMTFERNCSALTEPEIYLNNPENESFQDVSLNSWILMRADTLFYSPTSPVKTPYSYGNAMSAFRLGRGGADYNNDEWFAGVAWEAGLIQFYPEASKVARFLLEDLVRPTATFLEFKDIRRFVCGRCHDVQLKSWEGMVQHYLLERRKWARIEGVLSKFDKLDITYNDVHDLHSGTGDLVNLLSPKEASDIHAKAHSEEPFAQCKLCETAGEKFIEPKERLLAHVRDAHEIDEPKLLEHFYYKVFDSSEVRPPQRRGFAACVEARNVW
ncbi:hypothetical protein BDV93DRAFT_528950 [Ceratobasidium sp. AG-I]|nr:hypothetical protein BDV93DRAFT_528950 [Ceratobasidium sp. AG-I]